MNRVCLSAAQAYLSQPLESGEKETERSVSRRASVVVLRENEGFWHTHHSHRRMDFSIGKSVRGKQCVLLSESETMPVRAGA